MNWHKHAAVPYVAPFAAFMLLLVVGPELPFGKWEQPLRVVLLAAAIGVFSRRVLSFRTVMPLASIGLGILVFILWVAPDLLIPGYRGHWLFQNAVTGQLASSLPPDFRMDPVVLVSRTIRAVILVPVLEELFWRGWLMRWLVNSDFEKAPVGAYRAMSFWVTALLFASEHGPYWDVGLIAGVAYNLWAVKTKRLADCMLAHAVTNAALSGYIILTGKWEYWL